MPYHNDSFLSRTHLERQYAVRALSHWGMGDARLRLLKCEATALFSVETTDGRRFVLRLHPPHRHPRACVEAEVIWLRAIAENTDLRVPKPLPASDGALLVDSTLEGVDEPRRCAMLAWVPGRHRRKRLAEKDAYHFGETLAKLHNCAERFGGPSRFARWDFDGDAFDEVASEARQLGPARLNGSEMRVIEEAIALAQMAINQTGRSLENYGLIHADPNLGNVLFEREQANLIDFEVCCYGYFLFDIARSLVEFMRFPNTERLQTAFHGGYSSHRPIVGLNDPLIKAFMAMNLVDYLAWALANERQLDPERMAHDSTVWVSWLRRVMTDK